MKLIFKFFIYFIAPLILTFLFGYGLYSVAKHMPGMEAYTLSGLVVFAVFGFIAGRSKNRFASLNTASAVITFALFFSVFTLLFSPPSQKTPILVALGFWAVPFVCLVALLFASKQSPFATLQSDKNAT